MYIWIKLTIGCKTRRPRCSTQTIGLVSSRILSGSASLVNKLKNFAFYLLPNCFLSIWFRARQFSFMLLSTPFCQFDCSPWQCAFLFGTSSVPKQERLSCQNAAHGCPFDEPNERIVADEAKKQIYMIFVFKQIKFSKNFIQLRCHQQTLNQLLYPLQNVLFQVLFPAILMSKKHFPNVLIVMN